MPNNITSGDILKVNVSFSTRKVLYFGFRFLSHLENLWNFLGSPVVKTLSSKEEVTGSVPGKRTKIPHAWDLAKRKGKKKKRIKENVFFKTARKKRLSSCISCNLTWQGQEKKVSSTGLQDASTEPGHRQWRSSPRAFVFTEIYRKVSMFSFAAFFARCLHAKSLQSCLTLCDPMDCNPSGSSVHGILQAWILRWVAISFSRGSSGPRDWTQISGIAGRFITIRATWGNLRIQRHNFKCFDVSGSI